MAEELLVSHSNICQIHFELICLVYNSDCVLNDVAVAAVIDDRCVLLHFWESIDLVRLKQLLHDEDELILAFVTCGVFSWHSKFVG